MTRTSLCCAAFLFAVPLTTHAGELRASLEGGATWQSRNDFRIPGDGGTLVDLAAYEPGPFSALRATLSWDLTPRQSLRLLAAPLRIAWTRSSRRAHDPRLRNRQCGDGNLLRQSGGAG